MMTSTQKLILLQNLFLLSFGPMLLQGCGAEESSVQVSHVPLAIYETQWPSDKAGMSKTQGPIQFRYRLEEFEGGQFKLYGFARTSLRNVGSWNIELLGLDAQRLDSTAIEVQKTGSLEVGEIIQRQFSFKLTESSQKSVGLRVAAIIGEQMVTKTFKVKLGPILPVVVETCETTELCERILGGKTTVEGL